MFEPVTPSSTVALKAGRGDIQLNGLKARSWHRPPWPVSFVEKENATLNYLDAAGPREGLGARVRGGSLTAELIGRGR